MLRLARFFPNVAGPADVSEDCAIPAAALEGSHWPTSTYPQISRSTIFRSAHQTLSTVPPVHTRRLRKARSGQYAPLWQGTGLTEGTDIMAFARKAEKICRAGAGPISLLSRQAARAVSQSGISQGTCVLGFAERGRRSVKSFCCQVQASLTCWLSPARCGHASLVARPIWLKTQDTCGIRRQGISRSPGSAQTTLTSSPLPERCGSMPVCQ